MDYYQPEMVQHGDWGWGLLMMVFWLAIIGAVVFVVLRVSRDHNDMSTHGRPDPVDIAKERYARGDITKEQFDQLVEDLK